MLISLRLVRGFWGALVLAWCGEPPEGEGPEGRKALGRTTWVVGRSCLYLVKNEARDYEITFQL